MPGVGRGKKDRIMEKKRAERENMLISHFHQDGGKTKTKSKSVKAVFIRRHLLHSL